MTTTASRRAAARETSTTTFHLGWALVVWGSYILWAAFTWWLIFVVQISQTTKHLIAAACVVGMVAMLISAMRTE